MIEVSLEERSGFGTTVLVAHDEVSASVALAAQVARVVSGGNGGNGLVNLALATGNSMVRVYAELARLHNVPLVPHNWGTAINFAASIHLVAAMPQGYLCEYPVTPRTWGQGAQQGEEYGPSPMMVERVRNPVAISQGRALVPKAPGLGVEARMV